jgi:uncharacterized protein YndB with AHSA1/START domain
MTGGAPPALVVVQRVLPAPPEIVYAEWIDPDGMLEWMCPRPVQPTEIELDPRPGGGLRIEVLDDGSRVTITGRYLVLDRPNRIQFTWNCTAWAPPATDSVVTIILEPHQDGQTLMTIHHAQLPPPEYDSHDRGWAMVAEQLAGRIASDA